MRSASWITDGGGLPIQYIHYAPYGELIDNQQVLKYDERYKFTTKELDAESGYYYFGARYLLSELGNWLSVDPLADKNIANTPYMYCNGNPIMLIDPDGRDWYENESGEIKWTDFHNQTELKNACIKGNYLGEAFVNFEGSTTEHWGSKGTLSEEDAKPAIVTIYGVNGADDIKTYNGMTLPFSNEYSTLNEGDYHAGYQDMPSSIYGEKGARAHGYATALTYLIRPLQNGKSLKGTNKGKQVDMTGVYLHRTNWDGDVTHSSKGCLVIDGRDWRLVEKQLSKSQNIYIRLRR